MSKPDTLLAMSRYPSEWITAQADRALTQIQQVRDYEAGRADQIYKDLIATLRSRWFNRTFRKNATDDEICNTMPTTGRFSGVRQNWITAVTRSQWFASSQKREIKAIRAMASVTDTVTLTDEGYSILTRNYTP